MGQVTAKEMVLVGANRMRQTYPSPLPGDVGPDGTPLTCFRAEFDRMGR
jgi:hypothetical protein